MIKVDVRAHLNCTHEEALDLAKRVADFLGSCPDKVTDFQVQVKNPQWPFAQS